MAREHSFYCSSFVQHVFRKAGLDLFPGIDVKNTTPEDLGRSPVPFKMWVLERDVAAPLLKTMAGKVRHRLAVRSRVRREKRAGK